LPEQIIVIWWRAGPGKPLSVLAGASRAKPKSDKGRFASDGCEVPGYTDSIVKLAMGKLLRIAVAAIVASLFAFYLPGF
jgi:hypothetical protein